MLANLVWLLSNAKDHHVFGVGVVLALDFLLRRRARAGIVLWKYLDVWQLNSWKGFGFRMLGL